MALAVLAPRPWPHGAALPRPGAAPHCISALDVRHAAAWSRQGRHGAWVPAAAAAPAASPPPMPPQQTALATPTASDGALAPSLLPTVESLAGGTEVDVSGSARHLGA